jgi:hypothetical protein
MSLPRRFAVVQVNGQFYEVERPVGFDLLRLMVHFSAPGVVERVWIEGVSLPKDQPMSNPYLEGEDA